ncbi:MAG: tRNA (N6-isopentenyl adenosine(37)-C2)-methylthiotransferase MiaB [Calditrichaeota bacterium]|nr:MAG: tRNA (N6-isopentenyl adenosine(37)-C2)-methylthiotransferase MiaB [Calditrichota bacterium]
MPKVYIETYGCQMNEYDSEIVQAILQENRYQFVVQPEEAEILLLNTCSVRENATRKVLARVHALRHLTNGREKIIGLLGCMTTNLRQSLLENKKMRIDLMAGPDSYKRLPGLLDQALTDRKAVHDLKLSRSETYSDIHPFRAKSVNGWIAVMRGCDNYCTFCVVPYARGRERSRSIDSVLNEVRRLAEQGFRQVTLLGQNVNSYHHQNHDFAFLLNKVSEIDDIWRIRFTSPHPKDFPDSLLKTVADNSKVCKHIHLPLQAGADRILDRMNRTYSRQQYMDLVDKIRQYCPSIALTTDIIVGFPGETDEEFENTLDVVQRVQFDSAFIFKYSPRRGTIAARKYPDDVTPAQKTERIVHLNAVQKEISLNKNRSHIGEAHQVLIEELVTRKSDLDVQGRTDGNKLVILPKGDLQVGEMVSVRISGASANVLKGKVIQASIDLSAHSFIFH